MAEPQSPPLNPDGSYVSSTWAEGGANTEPGAGRKDTGFLPGGVDSPPADDWNWAHLQAMRYARVTQGRVILSSDGLSSSWMPPGTQGQWSTDGVGALEGFLSDDPLGVNTVVTQVFVDPDADGSGVRMQVSVPKAGPHTFPASRDTYVYVPIDTVVGGTAEEPELTYLSVALGFPAPATPVGTVLVWRVETDLVTIVDQEILVPRFPVFNQLGVLTFSASSLLIQNDAMIGGDLGVNGSTVLGDDPTADTVTINAPTTVLATNQVALDLDNDSASTTLTADNGGSGRAARFSNGGALGTVAIENTAGAAAIEATGTGAGATLSVENMSTGFAAELISGDSTTTLQVENQGDGSAAALVNDDPAAATLVVTNNTGAGVAVSVTGGSSSFLGSMTLADNSGQTVTCNGTLLLQANATLATTQILTLAGSARISGGTTSRVETGTIALQIGAAAPAANGEIAATTGGTPAFRASGVGRFVFGGINGPWVDEDADQVPMTLVAATTFLTTSSKTNVNGLLRIRVSGEMQRTAAGVNTISIEQDQGTSTWVAIDNGGITTKGVTTVSTADANDWTVFQIERTFGAGGTDTFFRLVVSAGASTARIRDTHLTVRRLGA